MEIEQKTNKQEYTHTERRPIEFKHAFKVWCLIMITLFAVDYILDGYSDKPETRHVPTYNDYSRLNSTKPNPHCRND